MTKDNIIIAALRLFLLRGYKNVSLVDVAQEVGITKGGIYYYFGSKEDLLRAASYHLLNRFETKFAELFSSKKSFLALLNALMVDQELELYMESILLIQKGDYRESQASLRLEAMRCLPELQEQIDHSNLHFRELIEQKLLQAQQLGEIRQDLDTLALASIILSILSGQNVLGNDINTPILRQQMRDSLWQFIGVPV